MTYPSHPPYPSNPSNGASPPHPGNGVADMRERVRALEVQHCHLDGYTRDRIRAHHDRLLSGDRLLQSLSYRTMELERTSSDNTATIARTTERVTALIDKMVQEEARRKARKRTRLERRSARREALALLQWFLVLVGMIGVVTGYLSKEQVAGLSSLKGLVP